MNLWWIIPVGYGLCWLLTARLLFGRWRAGGTLTVKAGRFCGVHGESEDRYGNDRHRKNCCLDAPLESDGELTAVAMLAVLAWFVFLAAVLVRARPPETAAEVAAAAEARDKELEQVRARNAELEQELGIQETKP